ncbi:hypothetical protein QT970_13805 [Microcoleus sp. herbarium8]|uniref:hypothetical protein n=1 Tax=Microcoleus sp. herbarium8 TaxID=3055436 RepID=UPI002FD325DD
MKFNLKQHHSAIDRTQPFDKCVSEALEEDRPTQIVLSPHQGQKPGFFLYL